MQGTLPEYPTKKALREAVEQQPSQVRLVATSVVGNEYDGKLVDAPDGTFYVVGPSPHTNRKWYAQITKTGSEVRVK